MAGEWTVRSLEDSMEALIDYRGKTPQKMPFGIPLITAKVVKGGRIETPEEFIAVDDYVSWMRRGIPKAGDVVVTTEAPLGEVAQLGTERVALAQRLITLRGKSGVLDNGFLKFLMQSEDVQDQLSARASGTTVLGIKQSELRKVLLRLPPIDEQRAIGHILGTLDDKIELNRQMNETLETMAQAIFRSSIVDAAASGLTKGWTKGSILDQAKLLSGGTPKTNRKYYWGGEILWASAKDVSQCGHTFLVTTERTITANGLEESATQLIPTFSTVVVARGATTGRMVMFGRDMAMNQTCYALASTTGTPFALYCLVGHEMKELVRTAHGSVFDTITTSTFINSTVPLPPKHVLESFEKIVSPIFRRILVNTKESRTLAAMRDTLLPKLLSGEIRLKDVAVLDQV